MMKRMDAAKSRVLQFAFNVTVGLGALACILQWAGIKPEDFRRMTLPLPHWLWLLVGLILFAISLRDSILKFFGGTKSSKLVIHSAEYGAGTRWRNVTAILQERVRDDLILPIENEFLGDPAPMEPKELKLDYSYGAEPPHRIVKSEHSLLMLPEDSRITIANPTLLPPQDGRLTVRVKIGFFGRIVGRDGKVLQGQDVEIILLEVKVDGPSTILQSWTLNLEREGQVWKPAYYNPIQKFIGYIPGVREIKPDELRAKHFTYASETLDSGVMVPSEGWIHFRAEYSHPRFHDLIFGAIFVLTAVEKSGAKSSCRLVAGEWLNPMVVTDY